MRRALVFLMLAFACLSSTAQTYQPYWSPKAPFFNAGVVCAGCKLYTFAAGTSNTLATYSDSAGTLNANPVIMDANGLATIYLSGSSYKFILKTAADVQIWSQDNITSVSQLAGDSVFQYADQKLGTGGTQISNAITDCNGQACVVMISPKVSAGAPASIPDNAALWDFRSQGRLSIRTNPTNVPAVYSCGLSIIVGPPTYSNTNPVANNCVALYTAVQAPSGVPSWGANSLVTVPVGVTLATVWGHESDVNLLSTGNLGGFGYDSVSGGWFQAPAYYAFRCYSATNIIPVGGWKECLHVQGVTDSMFNFDTTDTGLQITQAVTASGSPQSVTTNGVCSSAPTSQLYVGAQIAVDSGGSQEDVTITNAVCAGGVFSITAIFTKNHVNPTNLTEYYARRIWDGRNIGPVSNNPTYNWGSVKKWCDSSTAALLSFGVKDASGVERVTQYFSCANLTVFQSIGGGWVFNDVNGVSQAQLGTNGRFITYSSVATVGNGVPAEYGTIDLTAQTASIASTIAYSVPGGGAGLYRISIYGVVTSVGTTSTLPTACVLWTDKDSSGTPQQIFNVTASGLTNTSNTTATFESGTIVLNVKASTTINYAFGNACTGGSAYASTGSAMQYAAHVRVEAL